MANWDTRLESLEAPRPDQYALERRPLPRVELLER